LQAIELVRYFFRQIPIPGYGSSFEQRERERERGFILLHSSIREFPSITLASTFRAATGVSTFFYALEKASEAECGHWFRQWPDRGVIVA
jgi:hypothetical protein